MRKNKKKWHTPAYVIFFCDFPPQKVFNLFASLSGEFNSPFSSFVSPELYSGIPASSILPDKIRRFVCSFPRIVCGFLTTQHVQNRDKSLFFQKKCPNVCICAKFVVTLQRKMVIRERKSLKRIQGLTSPAA